MSGEVIDGSANPTLLEVPGLVLVPEGRPGPVALCCFCRRGSTIRTPGRGFQSSSRSE
jgi:hypothetical protein